MFKRIERSWGSYVELFRCKWLCIKILHFLKDKPLSTQRHTNRHELWIWLIKPMQWHTFKAAQDCRVLEVQFGSDVRESDIDRV